MAPLPAAPCATGREAAPAHLRRKKGVNKTTTKSEKRPWLSSIYIEGFYLFHVWFPLRKVRAAMYARCTMYSSRWRRPQDISRDANQPTRHKYLRLRNCGLPVYLDDHITHGLHDCQCACVCFSANILADYKRELEMFPFVFSNFGLLGCITLYACLFACLYALLPSTLP